MSGENELSRTASDFRRDKCFFLVSVITIIKLYASRVGVSRGDSGRSSPRARFPVSARLKGTPRVRVALVIFAPRGGGGRGGGKAIGEECNGCFIDEAWVSKCRLLPENAGALSAGPAVRKRPNDTARGWIWNEAAGG